MLLLTRPALQRPGLEIEPAPRPPNKTSGAQTALPIVIASRLLYVRAAPPFRAHHLARKNRTGRRCITGLALEELAVRTRLPRLKLRILRAVDLPRIGSVPERLCVRIGLEDWRGVGQYFVRQHERRRNAHYTEHE